ncbi:hypothetical protein [Desulforamulus aquiferis]|uniref:Polymerase beta nucleotidyltransferase domain-containing protein n=1 Tax=Desulforamulus aquiferis TaxID=1397668 RepID=A0AAW7ZBW9_9FIRM|nr:hypothetical protein [Desulforamulus aquiferis]
MKHSQQLFKPYPKIVAVYLFGFYAENIALARDVDLAVLTSPSKSLYGAIP